MLYTTITVGEKDYKCRLNAKACVELEKKLGTNPLNVFIGMSDGNNIPNLTTMLVMLHASLQTYEHSMTMEKVYDLFDKWVEEGHGIEDLIFVIIEIFKASGFFPSVEENEKN